MEDNQGWELVGKPKPPREFPVGFVFNVPGQGVFKIKGPHDFRENVLNITMRDDATGAFMGDFSVATETLDQFISNGGWKEVT